MRKLGDQIAFPLYVASKEVIRRYSPLLNGLDLTYTQYLVMMVLWEEENIGIKELGDRLFLDSGTLTPLVKKMQAKGYIEKSRSEDDLRKVVLKLTPKGRLLKKKAAEVASTMETKIPLEKEEVDELHRILSDILNIIRTEQRS